jgi:hypothetical protein
MNDTCTMPLPDQEAAKIDKYLGLVETRILRALSVEAVQESCSTVLLLAFATIDALGKLTHPDADARPGVRFKYFLALLGPAYKSRSAQLWKLRNALVHNAINVESFLSSVDIEGWAHLQTLGGTGLIYINTSQFTADLKAAFQRIKARLVSNGQAARLAAARLKWIDNTPRAIGSAPIPTPPSQVDFVVAS